MWKLTCEAGADVERQNACLCQQDLITARETVKLKQLEVDIAYRVLMHARYPKLELHDKVRGQKMKRAGRILERAIAELERAKADLVVKYEVKEHNNKACLTDT